MTVDLESVLRHLRRWPDFESPELRAWDAADRLILDEAGDRLLGADVAVVGDNYGALTLGALHLGAASVRVHQDSLAGERALAANAAALSVEADQRVAHFRAVPLEAGAFADSSLVLVRLPRSLEALDEIAAIVAADAAPNVIVLAGGRLKHMSLSMNEVLLRHFGSVTATRARQKSRVLVAQHPIAGAVPEPRRRYYADLGLWVVATGGVFAGASVDIGARAMLEVLDRAPTVRRAIDFGCGTGVLATALARLQPGAEIVASDNSVSAVASARLTTETNGLRIETKRDDALSLEPDASADLILLNPPFHSGAAVHSGAATLMFDAAARVLRPGGELWTVWNSHLAYKPALRRAVGVTREVSRTAKFTVTASTKQG